MAKRRHTSGPVDAREPSVDRGRSRAPRGSLSRDVIVDVAIGVVRAGDIDQLSIRKLATQLGVAPMALYRHVSGKADLLDEVVDRLLAEVWEPAPGSIDWIAWISECADRFRRFLVERPAALSVYLRHPVSAPTAARRRQATIDVLERAGATPEEARRAVAAVQTYTIGFAALQAARAGWEPPEGDESARELADYATPAQFAQGLTYLLEGIQRHTATKPARRAARA